MSFIINSAISRMKAPHEMRIICVDVTNKCDLACSNCTRLLANQDYFWDMTPDNFRLAVRSLKSFEGIVIMIGGNPCMHPKFAELCNIFEEERPQIEKRGLWTNNFFKHEKLSKEKFGVFNLNTHNNNRAIKSLKNYLGTKWYHPNHSYHAPILTAIKDLYGNNTEKMWETISECDVNKNWSASIVQNKGKLRAYFCEVAASFDLARHEDHGIEITEDWWKNDIDYFSNQIEHFCPGCGISAKLEATKDSEEIDTYTASNSDIVKISEEKNGRQTVKISKLSDLKKLDNEVTNYSDRTKKNIKYKISRFKWKFKKYLSYMFSK